MKFNRGDFLNIPNYISISRIVAIPLFMIFLMLIRRPQDVFPVWNALMSLIAGLIYIAASVSDLVDGYLARRAHITGAIGKFLDPLADKLLNLAALIMLIPLGRIPAWLVVLILFREIGITALRGMAANERIVIAASKWGKYKNAFGSCGVAGLILHYPFLSMDWRSVGWLMLLISVVFSFGSGIHYTYNFFAEVKRRNMLKPTE
jgi:CDP-diacylglycerol--glycerol-3-phosphate 3-phosphatidyltransferase